MFHVKHASFVFVISTDRICASWYMCIEMRCAPEWRNLFSTSGKGLKNHTITTPYLPLWGRTQEGACQAG